MPSGNSPLRGMIRAEASERQTPRQPKAAPAPWRIFIERECVLDFDGLLDPRLVNELLDENGR